MGHKHREDIIANHTNFEKCDFNDKCDFCNDPKHGSYAKMIYTDVAECAYYICGKCALASIAEETYDIHNH